jgi:hypothetical protein
MALLVVSETGRTMYKVGRLGRSAGRSGGGSQILALLAILGATCAVAGAQIEVNEVGLHGGESVYGLYAPPTPVPYLNPEDITLFAWGETNPDLYADVSFSAYGLYGATGVDNVGCIDVVATGGNAHASGSSIAGAGVWAYVMYTLGGVTNTGDLRITAVGGAADANTHAEAYSIVRAIYARGDVNNTGDITIKATGGNAHSNAGNAMALGGAEGVYAFGGLITNSGRIDIVATGGTAVSRSTSMGAQAIARAGATGLNFWNGALSNTGEISVRAQGGNATGRYYAEAMAMAYGIGVSDADAENSGDITAVAIGGRADGGNRTNADATVNVIIGGHVNNTGDLTAEAVGGTATTDGSGDFSVASAESYAAGINMGGIATNSGNINITVTGGTAEPSAGANLNSVARAYARGYGVIGEDGVSNSGAITGVVIGGTAEANGIQSSADAQAHAYGIHTFLGDANNTAEIRITATGGTAAGADAYANAEVDGITAYGNVNNSGAITAVATGGTANAELDIGADAQGTAYGVYITNGLITNGGPIDVAASGGTALSGGAVSAAAAAYGFSADDSALVNSNAVTVAAIGGSATGTATDADYGLFATAWAYGFYLPQYDITPHPERYVSNSGDLAVTATGGSAQGSTPEANASAWANGIEVHRAPMVNSGDITVAATGGNALSSSNVPPESGAFANAVVYGIQSTDGDLDNRGAVVVSGTGGTATGQDAAGARTRAEVYGINAFGSSTVIQNRAPLTVTATGGTSASAASYATAEAQAIGLWTYYPDVDNAGDITVTAQAGNGSTGANLDVSAFAYGMRAFYGEAVNSGNITVVAAAGTRTTEDGTETDAQAFAVGIEAADSALRNSGTVNVTAEGGSFTGGGTRVADAYAYGIRAVQSAVNNSGDVTATATAAPGFLSNAYGIRSGGDSTLTNTGIIRASADQAYEVYVTDHTMTLVDTYNVTLDGDPNRASFGVADGATLALNNATLTTTALAHETLWGREYKLFETEGAGAVDGNFAEVRAVNPNTTAIYHDQGTAASADDAVSLAYTPVAAAPSASAAVEKQLIAQAGDVVNHHMTTMLLQNLLSPSASGLLASAGSTAESIALAEAAAGKPAGVFVEPYYSLLDHDANPLGYDARLWGFSAGYERYFENTILGLHLGYGHSDIDYTGAGFSGNSEDQDVVTGGFCGLTRWEPWILDYGVTAFYGSQDYEGRTGLNLEERETASYDSYGTAATLMAGHIFRWGPHVFLPEAGLNWLWMHRQRYTTEATDPSWDTTYSALDDHDVYAAAALQWMSSFVHDDIRVTPSVALGVRYLLTDDETSAVLSVPGAAPVLVESEQDRTALTLSGAVTLTRAPHALSLSYDGDYSPNLHRHSVWLRYTWLF